MNRTRAFNRARRFTARRRRRNLRSALPSMKIEFRGFNRPFDHSEELFVKAITEESLLDLQEIHPNL